MPRKRGRPSKKDDATSRNVLVRWLTRPNNAARWHTENKHVLCREVAAMLQERGMAHRKEGYVRYKIDTMEKEYIKAKKWLLETGMHDAYERGTAPKEVKAQVLETCNNYPQLAAAFRGLTFSTGGTIELDSSDEDEESDGNDGDEEKDETEGNEDELAITTATMTQKSANSDESSGESSEDEEEEEEEEKVEETQTIPWVAQRSPSVTDSEPASGEPQAEASGAGTDKSEDKDEEMTKNQAVFDNEPEEEEDDDSGEEKEEEKQPRKQEEKATEDENEEDEDESGSETDDSASPNTSSKPSVEPPTSTVTPPLQNELEAPDSAVPVETPAPASKTNASPKEGATNAPSAEEKTEVEVTEEVPSPPALPQKRKVGRPRKTVAKKAAPAAAPKKRVGRPPKNAATPPKRKARDVSAPPPKRTRIHTASKPEVASKTAGQSELSDIEREALLERVRDERTQRLQMYEMDRAKLKYELEAKQVEVVCAKALARKKLVDAGISLEEVDRILPLEKQY